MNSAQQLIRFIGDNAGAMAIIGAFFTSIGAIITWFLGRRRQGIEEADLETARVLRINQYNQEAVDKIIKRGDELEEKYHQLELEYIKIQEQFRVLKHERDELKREVNVLKNLQRGKPD